MHGHLGETWGKNKFLPGGLQIKGTNFPCLTAAVMDHPWPSPPRKQDEFGFKKFKNQWQYPQKLTLGLSLSHVYYRYILIIYI